MLLLIYQFKRNKKKLNLAYPPPALFCLRKMDISHFQVADQSTTAPSLMARWNAEEASTGVDLLRPPATNPGAWGEIMVYSALLVDMPCSQPTLGSYKLGGRSQPKELQLDAGGVPANPLPTTLWGNYQRSTWCYGIGEAINEAIASNSRGPLQEITGSTHIHWLILHLPIPFEKLAKLMKQQLIMTGIERNQISSLRLYGDIDADKVTAVDLCEQFAIDIDIWGKIKLGSWQRGTNHCCTECGAQGSESAPISTWNTYCANCWARHLVNKRLRA